MNTECDICCKKSFIIPCGAKNSCNAFVCYDCRYGKDEEFYFETKCYYCFGIDYKQGCLRELGFNFFEGFSVNEYEPNKPYILALVEYKTDKAVMFYDDMWEENPYCFPCD